MVITNEFEKLLVASGAVLSDVSLSDDKTVKQVDSFGDAQAEREAAQSSAAVFCVPELIRVRLTGKDRLKFLHNFCTSDVKGMQIGDVAEAFLTDVKARILGHGYIAAFAECLELWMLPGNADSLLMHLQKYIIVEDVDVQIVPTSPVFAVAGPKAPDVVAAVWESEPPSSGHCLKASAYSVLSVVWDEQPLFFVSVTDQLQLIDAWQELRSQGATPAGQIAFEDLRIQERFPRIGVDLSDANMAPEADRNEAAICYTKGCYLGQEPIARLDAMGHVNRQLYAGTVQPHTPEAADAVEKWPLVTSLAEIPGTRTSALAVLTLKAAKSGEPILCQSTDGRKWMFIVLKAASR